MKVVLDLTNDEVEDFRKTLQDPKAVKNIREWDEWRDWWKEGSENELKDEMAGCLCGTGQRYEAPRYQEFLEKGLKGLWKKPVQEIEKTLKNYGVRWPTKKAAQLDPLKRVSLSKVMQYVAKNFAGGTLEDERGARGYLIGLGIRGLGPKQGSNFLRVIGFARNLVPLDIRWLNRFHRMMKLSEDEDVNYTLLEDVVVDIAKRLGVDPVVLDAAVWTVEGK